MENLKTEIRDKRKAFDLALAQIKDRRSLQDIRNEYLSRQRGVITGIFERLKHLKPEERPEIGRLINDFKNHVQESLQVVQKKYAVPKKTSEKVDLTLPGEKRYWGAPHPILLFQQKIENIFLRMGFSIADGPEIETDYYNFEALNFPPHHPARDDWDTLYITDDVLLRTHTSPVQIRVMEKRKPPIRIINPGKVYRKEAPDPTHLPMFYQVEGLVVDLGITFAHLKGTLEYFLKALFHEKIRIRFRPSFFPFTEPSAEVDIGCVICKGEGCRVCKQTGWLEILGAGMIDPEVFKMVDYDPEEFSGFAFGIGMERIAMLKYGIDDIRLFYENDLRFLNQF